MGRKEHLQDAFADFVAFEGAAGGPSPNLKLIKAAADAGGASTPADRAWLAGCYAAVYNTPSSVQLWSDWPLGRLLKSAADHGPHELVAYLRSNWDGIVIHSNRRRTHANIEKLASGMLGLAAFAVEEGWEKGDDYDRLWADVTAVPAIGRYFGIKLAGTLHALGLTEAQQYDIRPRGAKNGRRTLALLHDDMKLDQRAGNRKVIIDHVDGVAFQTKLWLETIGLKTSWFEFEALLCEFNQMVKGDRYPQKTSDADLDALYKMETHFSTSHRAFEIVREARRRVLPEYAVDVLKRKELLDVYAKHGYVWSDAVYDYGATTDLSDPVVLSRPRTDWTPKTRGGQLAAST